MEFGDCRDCKERLSSCLLPPCLSDRDQLHKAERHLRRAGMSRYSPDWRERSRPRTRVPLGA